MDEIPLMEVVYVLQEELHIAGLFGQNQTALLFCYRVTTHKFLESAVSNRIALNIAQSKRHARPRLRAQSPQCNCAAARRGARAVGRTVSARHGTFFNCVRLSVIILVDCSAAWLKVEY